MFRCRPIRCTFGLITKDASVHFVENVFLGLGSYKAISEPIQVNNSMYLFWLFCSHFGDFPRYLRWILGRLVLKDASVHFSKTWLLQSKYFTGKYFGDFLRDNKWVLDRLKTRGMPNSFFFKVFLPIKYY